LADLVKRLQGRSSRLLQAGFPKLKERYSGNHFWAIVYGAWSTGNISNEMVQEYLEHYRNPSNKNNNSFIFEILKTDFQSMPNLCTFSAQWFS